MGDVCEGQAEEWLPLDTHWRWDELAPEMIAAW